METIGEVIRAARGSRDQEWLANQLGVSPASIGHWERGERNPKPSRFTEIETTLEITPGTLATLRVERIGTRRQGNSAIGELIKEARGSREQAWLAEKLGVSRSTISAWERGDRMPTPDRHNDIERALDLVPGTLSALRFSHEEQIEELKSNISMLELMTIFDELEPSNQRALLATAKALLETQS